MTTAPVANAATVAGRRPRRSATVTSASKTGRIMIMSRSTRAYAARMPASAPTGLRWRSSNAIPASHKCQHLEERVRRASAAGCVQRDPHSSKDHDRDHGSDYMYPGTAEPRWRINHACDGKDDTEVRHRSTG